MTATTAPTLTLEQIGRDLVTLAAAEHAHREAWQRATDQARTDSVAGELTRDEVERLEAAAPAPIVPASLRHLFAGGDALDSADLAGFLAQVEGVNL